MRPVLSGILLTIRSFRQPYNRELMRPGRHELDLLWKRVEDARLQWKFAHQYANEVSADRLTGGMPSADGSYAHLRALRAQRLAVENYRSALEEFNAALAEEQAPQAEPAAQTTNNSHQPGTLTAREREVLKLIASGKSSKEIAVELGIAFRTVVCHRYRVQTKLNVHKTADLTRAALKMGLIKL